MSDTPSEAPAKSIMPAWIRGPQDFIGGIVLMAVCASSHCGRRSDLQGMHGFSFGAGTAPRMFATLLMGLGAAVVVVGIVQRRPASGDLCLARTAVRHALASFFSPSAIRPLGLVISGLASFLISALGSMKHAGSKPSSSASA